MKNFIDARPTDFITKENREERFKNSLKKNVNLFNEVLETSKHFGNLTTILQDISGSVDYKKLLISTYVMSEKLDRHLAKDKHVGIYLPNSIAHVVTLLSLFKIGKTPAIFNFSMGEQTLNECAELSNVRTIITSKTFIIKADLEEVVNSLSRKVRFIYLEDIKEEITLVDKVKGLTSFQMKKRSHHTQNDLILFTSGSESKPKGVVLSHSNIYSNAYQAMCSIHIAKEDKIFNPLPMFHSFGLTAGTLLPLLFGVETYLYPSPLHYKEIPALIFKNYSTVLFGTSTFLEGYSRYAKSHELHSLKFVIAGAEKVKEEVHSTWMQKFGVRILEGYGCTETSPVLSLNTPFAFKQGTVGQLLPGIEYKLEPVDGIEKGGCLLVKGPNNMRGYLLHGQGFVPNDGWYDTGDVVEVDNEGFVSIISRLKRFAKIGGEMVSLNLIEKVAYDCFHETGFASVSIPDKRKGEKIILFTTFTDSTEKQLKKYLKSKKLANILMPSKLVFIEQIPVLGSGKTDYVTLQKLANNL